MNDSIAGAEQAAASAPGDLGVLRHPLALALLESSVPARVAYLAGRSPRVVPVWFHWTGSQLVFCSLPAAPKARFVACGDEVAVSIDANDFPYRSLSIRGPVDVERLDAVACEYEAASRRYLGEETGKAWAGGFPTGTGMWRFTLTPRWANLQDFETRFPSALVAAMGW